VRDRVRWVWGVAVAAAFVVFIVSLGSDVWEAYLLLWLLALGGYLRVIPGSHRFLSRR